MSVGIWGSPCLHLYVEGGEEGGGACLRVCGGGGADGPACGGDGWVHMGVHVCVPSCVCKSVCVGGGCPCVSVYLLWRGEGSRHVVRGRCVHACMHARAHVGGRSEWGWVCACTRVYGGGR